jgi:hypothetical protein
MSGRPSCLCSARDPPSEAAAASQGSHRPHSPTKVPSTSPCTYYSPSTRSRFPPSRHLARAERTAAGNGRRRRTTPPAPPRRNHGSKSSLGNPWTTPHPFPADPSAGARRNFAGCAGHRPRTTLYGFNSSRGTKRKTKGISVRSQNFQGLPYKSVS